MRREAPSRYLPAALCVPTSKYNSRTHLVHVPGSTVVQKRMRTRNGYGSCPAMDITP
jgi:hypothetical protein